MDPDATKKELMNYIHLSIHSFKRADVEGANQFLVFAAELFELVFPLSSSGKAFQKQLVLQVFEEPVRWVFGIHTSPLSVCTNNVLLVVCVEIFYLSTGALRIIQ
jgi:hypothetical protein